MCMIELNSLDLRYEDLRLKNKQQEARLLSSLAERGIEKPLQGVMIQDVPVLLDGFKRCRCAKKLNIMVVEFVVVAQNAGEGLLNMLRLSYQKPLSILEQAAFIDEFKTQNKLRPAEIAERIQCSITWVNTRLGLLEEMTEPIRRDLFGGAFPVCAYMQTLRPMMRKGESSKRQVEAFIKALRLTKLSIRDIQRLAAGYFHGPAYFREQIDQGHLLPMLEVTKRIQKESPDCSAFERTFLKDLERLDGAMRQVMKKGLNAPVKTAAFKVQALVLLAGLLQRSESFLQTMRSLHDQCGKA